MAYWLMKSEPEVFGIQALEAQQVALWDGVRNYQARNFLRQMKTGDIALFYHSNCKVPGVVGVMRIAREGYPDPTQFDANSRYFDPKSPLDNPRWTGVDVQFVENWHGVVSLNTLKMQPELQELPLVRKGNRLSLMPLSDAEYACIVRLKNQLSAD